MVQLSHQLLTIPLPPYHEFIVVLPYHRTTILRIDHFTENHSYMPVLPNVMPRLQTVVRVCDLAIAAI